MRIRLLPNVLLAVGVAFLPTSIFAQTSGSVSRNSLVDLLVSGADVSIVWSGYSPQVKAEAEKYRQRFDSYSIEPRAEESGAMKLVHAARLRYERKLAALSDAPEARTAAADFVARLQPNYEWEGYHDCPE